MVNWKNKNLHEGLARPTKHREIINTADLENISTNLYENLTSVTLRFRIWFLLSIQFVSRGLGFHEQQEPNSFAFKTDKNGHEYAALSHKRKKIGGMKYHSWWSKRKTNVSSPWIRPKCPVNSLKLFLAKTNPNATSLFNFCVKKRCRHPKKRCMVQ